MTDAPSMLLALLAGLGLMLGALAVVGWLVPRWRLTHREAVFDATPERLWWAVSQLVGLLRSVSGRTRSRVEVLESRPPSRLSILVVRGSVAERWTYDITPYAAGSTLRVQERIEIANPLARAFDRLLPRGSGRLSSTGSAPTDIEVIRGLLKSPQPPGPDAYRIR
jgi:hypothetical protein